jgi:hypothetical protein
MLHSFFEKISSKSSNRVLMILNIITTTFFFYFHFNEIAPDHYSYLAISEGIVNGRYTFWWDFDKYIPDTLRTPGYPLFVAAIMFLGGGLIAIKLVQLLLYFSALYLLNKLLTKFRNDYLYNNIFLLLLIPCIFIPYYIPLIYTEGMMITLVIYYAAVFVLVDDKKWYKLVLLAACMAAIFYVRPAFLYLPIFLTVANLLLFRFKKLKHDLLLILLFFVFVSPYGFWNLKTHDTFKLTPLESGGGMMFLGYWMHRLPGYTETDLWGTWMSNEIIKFVDVNDLDMHIAAWKADWQKVHDECDCLIKDEERPYLKKMEERPRLFKTYNTAYTICREKMLKKMMKEHIMDDPVWYLKTRIYTFFRLQITSIHSGWFKYRTSFKDRVILIYPLVLTLIYFIVFYVALFSMLKRIIKTKDDFLVLALIFFFYCILVHMPIALQSRYTIPVRVFMILIMTEYIYGIVRKKLMKIS